MTNTVFNFAIFWGVWLLVPMLIDGATYLTYLVGVWRISWRSRGARLRRKEGFYPPFVTLIIPVHNGERTLGACLQSIRRQSYPQECLQVVVVNNQSTDNSFQVFAREQTEPFEGTINWMDIPQKGKVHALNAGIHLAHGSLIVNIDCDTVLHPDAILSMARAFHAEPGLAAATGSIEVLPPEGLNQPAWKEIWAECEAMEYLAAFHIGRRYQAAANSLFTLAGAFSAFRREVLLGTFLYDRTTVSEDTKLTIDIHRQCAARGMRIGCVAEAVAYVEPTLSLSRLYAQRVRWQRGELEVAALQPDLDVTSVFRSRGLSVPRMLAIDHTLAFPRLVWTFLLPMLYFVGYPLPLVASATLGMHLFYSLIEALSMATCYALGDREVKARVRKDWYLFVVMPAYRFVLFWFRLGGFLNVLTDEAQWQVTSPWEDAARALGGIIPRPSRLPKREAPPPQG